MRLRNQGTAKPAATRKTLPTRNTDVKPSSECTIDAEDSETKQAFVAKGKQVKKNETSPAIIDDSDSNLERSAVEEIISIAETTNLTPESKVTSGTKLVAKRKSGRPTRSVSANVKAVSIVNSEETPNENVVESPNNLDEELPCDENIEEYVVKEKNRKNDLQGEDLQTQYDDDELEEYGDRVDYGDHDDEEVFSDNVADEPFEETERLDEECIELTTIAKERKIKKECEIFVGGLDRDAVEEDLREVFEKIGKVVEVRLHKNPATNKNKGYAFVKFSNKEHAEHALLEMKNPFICGKRCGTAPSEDNDTLFLGNICNTWTKEAVKQKLKEYGIEGIENITVVPDIQHEGLSRGFAFLEFSCHADAMLAYKRLQKPDVVFGHPERTAKVAFAEPLREPDPEIMASVKTVFLDLLPPHWDEDHVREKLKGYGEIVKVVLARNMSSAKRNDFGFVDFSTHKAAIACVDGVNNKQLDDVNSKTKVRARLSNPIPKTQAIKGGMSGGFRFRSGGNGTFSRSGRAFGRGGHHFNSKAFQHDQYYYKIERGRTSTNEHDFENRYSEFHRQRFIGQGGRRGSYGDGYHTSSRHTSFVGPSRQNSSGSWYDSPERAWRERAPVRRQAFSPQRSFNRSYGGRQYEDPYYYDESAHNMKRPYYMTDHDPEYMEPPRFRRRMDHPYPEVPFHETHYRDAYYAAGSDLYSNDYYVSDYGAYPPYYGDHYGGGY